MDAAPSDNDTLHISIEPALPCALEDCGRPATGALVERDADFPELWRLLPVCDACCARLRQRRQTDSATPLGHPIGATE